jgi:transcriptional regulator with XRE-family HTH domain
MSERPSEDRVSPVEHESWRVGVPPRVTAPTLARLGLRIRSARKERALTLRSVAAKVGVSLQAISQFEHGQTVPTVPTLVSLARAFDVPMGYFFLAGHDEELLALRERAVRLNCDLGSTGLQQAVERLSDADERPVRSAFLESD